MQAVPAFRHEYSWLWQWCRMSLWALHFRNFRKWSWINVSQSTRIQTSHSVRRDNTADLRTAKPANSPSLDSQEFFRSASNVRMECRLCGTICGVGCSFNCALICFVESRKPDFGESNLVRNSLFETFKSLSSPDIGKYEIFYRLLMEDSVFMSPHIVGPQNA